MRSSVKEGHCTVSVDRGAVVPREIGVDGDCKWGNGKFVLCLANDKVYDIGVAAYGPRDLGFTVAYAYLLRMEHRSNNHTASRNSMLAGLSDFQSNLPILREIKNLTPSDRRSFSWMRSGPPFDLER